MLAIVALAVALLTLPRTPNNSQVAGLEFLRQGEEAQRGVLEFFCPPFDDPGVQVNMC